MLDLRSEDFYEKIRTVWVIDAESKSTVKTIEYWWMSEFSPLGCAWGLDLSSTSYTLSTKNTQGAVQYLGLRDKQSLVGIGKDHFPLAHLQELSESIVPENMDSKPIVWALISIWRSSSYSHLLFLDDAFWGYTVMVAVPWEFCALIRSGCISPFRLGCPPAYIATST